MFLYRVGAEIIFTAHFILIAVALFGWAVPIIWLPYMAVLAGTFLSNALLGRCILSDWEFSLRKKYDPSISYDYSYSSYYTHKFTKQRISDKFLLRAGLLFTGISFVANLLPLFIQ